jgi:hypothetical protein
MFFFTTKTQSAQSYNKKFFVILCVLCALVVFYKNTFSQTADTVSETRQSKSSTTAVLLSLALPGLGQIYNESYWKTPVILGFAGYFGYVWKQENDLYRKYQTEYRNNPFNTQARRARDFYHDERDRFAWYLGVTYLLNAVDAYVDAQLFDFDVGTSLTERNSFTITITIKPFH